MKEVVTITEAKAKLSELVNQICVLKEKISITRKGKPAVVISQARVGDDKTVQAGYSL